MKPKIPQQIFKNESVATPKHDDMLLLFSSDSKLLKEIVEPYHYKHINKAKEETIDCEEEICLDKKNKRAYKKKFIFKIGDDFFWNINLPYNSYDADDLIEENEFEIFDLDKDLKTKKLTKKEFIKYLIKEERIKKIDTIENKKCKSEIKFSYEISWKPEYTIKNNSYYIGSVDLYVELTTSHKKVLRINENDYWEDYYNNEGIYHDTDYFLFEFKPQIKSFSEVIRQVKVYESYFKKINPIVVTYSDISRFEDVFKSQGIKLIQLQK